MISSFSDTCRTSSGPHHLYTVIFSIVCCSTISVAEDVWITFLLECMSDEHRYINLHTDFVTREKKGKETGCKLRSADPHDPYRVDILMKLEGWDRTSGLLLYLSRLSACSPQRKGKIDEVKNTLLLFLLLTQTWNYSQLYSLLYS